MGDLSPDYPAGSAANGGFKFHKRSQLFIRTYNVSPTVAAVCVGNPDSSALIIQHQEVTVIQPAFRQTIRNICLQKPQRTLTAWRSCNGRPKSETANPNCGTTQLPFC
jgi:hypothetical protein